MTYPFERYNEPFYAPKIPIVWAATNKLPPTVKILKVVPSDFSPIAISNLTAMGGSVSLKRGTMNLYKPINARSPLKNVPDKARAYELGTNILAKLEIPTRELEGHGEKLRAWYYPGTHGYMDKSTRKMITEPSTMGIEFRRTIDGIRCLWQEVHLRFESEEHLTSLEVKWHGLQPVKSFPVPTSEQLIAWVKEGRARAQPVETTGSRWIKVRDIKKLTVRGLEICYDADGMREDLEKFPDHLYPYAVLETEIDFGPDDRETLYLYCPVIENSLTRPIRKSSEFNIFPSKLMEKRQNAAEANEAAKDFPNL